MMASKVRVSVDVDGAVYALTVTVNENTDIQGVASVFAEWVRETITHDFIPGGLL